MKENRNKVKVRTKILTNEKECLQLSTINEESKSHGSFEVEIKSVKRTPGANSDSSDEVDLRVRKTKEDV